MMLSDRDIRSRLTTDWGNFQLGIEPRPHDHCFQPHSVDLTLSSDIKIEGSGWAYEPQQWQDLDISQWGGFKELRDKGQYPLMPGQFILASTYETLTMPTDLAGHVHGKSSIGRRGVAVHVTAGLLDAGWSGQITLEVYNHSSFAFWLKPGMKICQITFEQLSSPAERPYGHPELGSHYQGQSGPTVSVL